MPILGILRGCQFVGVLALLRAPSKEPFSWRLFFQGPCVWRTYYVSARHCSLQQVTGYQTENVLTDYEVDNWLVVIVAVLVSPRLRLGWPSISLVILSLLRFLLPILAIGIEIGGACCRPGV